MRCGTNFLLTVMVVAILVYSVIPRPNLLFVIGSRVVLIPLIAGLSYEVIRLAARNMQRGFVRALMRPGLLLQRLTTREPDLDQLEVAIASLRAVMTAEQLADVESRRGLLVPAVARASSSLRRAALTTLRPRGHGRPDRRGLERDEVVVVRGVAVVEPVEDRVDEVVEQRLRGPLREVGRDERSDDPARGVDRDVAQRECVLAELRLAGCVAPEQPEAVGPFARDLEEGPGAALGFEALGDVGEEELDLALEHLLEHRPVERLLGLEVAVDDELRDAGGRRDLVHRGRRVAGVRERFGGRLEDGQAPGRAPAGATYPAATPGSGGGRMALATGVTLAYTLSA